MLHYLDVMIGFVFTMLVLSLAVTAIVQAVPVYLRNLKGASLQNGLVDLMARIGHDPQTGRAFAGNLDALIGQVLRDPLVSPRRSALIGWVSALRNRAGKRRELARQRSSVLQREEFVRLLLDIAGTQDSADDTPLAADVRAAARRLIGIDDPAQARAALALLRDRIAALELAHPEWSNSKRADKAMLEILLNGPMKDFMAKLVGWYDQTIDRVDAAFTARVRTWTTIISALLVIALHLDSFDLLARLNADPVLREKVLETAIDAMATGSVKPLAQGQAAGRTEPQSKAIMCADKHLNVDRRPNLTGYAECMGLSQATHLELVAWPQNWPDWRDQWQTRGVPLALQLLGMILSLGLLSLGAPFWYETLAGLIKLRSTMARKDDAARAERQTTQVRL